MQTELKTNTSISQIEEEVLLPHGTLPYEIIRFRSFVTNQAHYHKLFDESYYVEEGNITVALMTAGSTSVEVRKYQQGELVIIPKGTVHKTLNGSADNKILVIYYPRYIETDWTIDYRLEQAVNDDFISLGHHKLSEHTFS